MPRHPNLIPTQMLNVALPLPVYTQMCAYLHSDLERRIPQGAFSRFLSELIRQFFNEKHMDLAPYLNVPSGALIVSGTPESIEALKRKLESQA
jgi:hypothetical protein